MKAHLLHPDRDFDFERPLPAHAPAFAQDIRLEAVIEAMGDGDRLIADIARKTILLGETEPAAIAHRQAVLRDCLAHPEAIRAIHRLAAETLDREARLLWHSADHSRIILASTLDLLKMLVEQLRALRSLAETHGRRFASEGLGRLCRSLASDLAEPYLVEVSQRLRDLNTAGGVLVSAELGRGNKGTNYVLRRGTAAAGWGGRLFGGRRADDAQAVEARDEPSARALSEIAEIGREQVARRLADTAGHVVGFFRSLHRELAFFLGCVNLADRLGRSGAETCFPSAGEPGKPALSFAGLYDLSLRLGVDETPIGNDLSADGKRLIVITGANQGGKSTFLRSVGLAQAMMQAGMFVAARAFRADPVRAIFTHFNREEDAALKSGKLDEELRRLSDIADAIAPGSAILFNEPFASTNEREGADIATGIVRALLDRDIKVFFVTHMSEFARRFYEAGREDALFLEAEREESGTRTFRLVESKPGRTGHGRDLYERIFGAGAGRSPG